MPTKLELTVNYENLVKDAISNINSGYFSVANRFRDTPNISERVFCYEFYYQLRRLIEESDLELQKNEIFIHGELAKAKYLGYSYITPDFIIHNPENGDSNLITIEIKPALEAFWSDEYGPIGIYKDFISLCSMLNNNYELGIFVLFNQSYDSLLTYWKNKKSKILDHHSENFTQYASSIKILIKESADSGLVEKTFQEFLDETNED